MEKLPDVVVTRITTNHTDRVVQVCHLMWLIWLLCFDIPEPDTWCVYICNSVAVQTWAKVTQEKKETDLDKKWMIAVVSGYFYESAMIDILDLDSIVEMKLYAI